MNKKTTIIGLIVAVLLVVGGFFIFTPSSNNNGANNSSSSVSDTNSKAVDMSQIPADLDAAVKSAVERQHLDNVYVIDVRTPAEWEAGHADGAVLWGLAEKLDKGELPQIDKDAEIYVYCRSGNRAGQAIRILQDAGFTNLTNIRSYNDWVAAGGPTATGL